MTGRELIVYILENHLEDEPVFKDGRFVGYMCVGEFARKHNVGIATVYTWNELGWLDSLEIGSTLLIADNFDASCHIKV